jgi:hypothetical protein
MVQKREKAKRSTRIFKTCSKQESVVPLVLGQRRLTFAALCRGISPARHEAGDCRAMRGPCDRNALPCRDTPDRRRETNGRSPLPPCTGSSLRERLLLAWTAHTLRLSTCNVVYWKQKIEGTKLRDLHTNRLLEATGWAVLRLWSHQEPSEVADKIADRVHNET